MKAPRTPRPYESPLREEQARHTADRILDATYALAGKGEREFGYVAIAREAGVSVPTVYRHFPTMDDLIRAFAEREQRTRGTIATDLAGVHDGIRRLAARFDDPADLFRRSARSQTLWQFSRLGTIPLRRAFLDAVFAKEAPHLPEPERTQLVDVGVALISSAMGEALRGYLELDGPQIAERMSLAFDCLIVRARQLSDASAPAASPRPPTGDAP